VDLNGKVTQAKADGNYEDVLSDSLKIVRLDKWENKDWLEKSPVLQEYLDNAHLTVEEGYYNVFLKYKKQKKWKKIKSGYADYEEYCSANSKEPSARVTELYKEALAALQKAAARRALQAKVDKQVECGKNRFLEEKYDAAMVCVNRGSAIVKKNPKAKLDTNELDYLKASVLQAIKIQKAIEAEKQRVAEENRKRIEEENRKAAEAARVAELKKRTEEERRIARAEAVDRARLRREEAKRRKEAEERRIKEERDRRWRAFLKKGAPLKPLVTTVFRPSEGVGKLKRGRRQKWQGGSQLPRPKDRSIASEDVYALEVEVPKTHKLTYLKNYSRKRAKSLLSPPRTQGKKRSYYTERFKGGRYYFEVKNEKSKKQGYDVKARIYKIPVTH
jgi:hypothetical protein